MVDGMSLTLGGATGAAIVTAIVKIWTSRNQKTELSPDPIRTEQSNLQVAWKDNAKDHENIFARMQAQEIKLAELSGRVDAQFKNIEKQLDTVTDMLSKLFDRIMGGKRK